MRAAYQLCSSCCRRRRRSSELDDNFTNAFFLRRRDSLPRPMHRGSFHSIFLLVVMLGRCASACSGKARVPNVDESFSPLNSPTT